GGAPRGVRLRRGDRADPLRLAPGLRPAARRRPARVRRRDGREPALHAQPARRQGLRGVRRHRRPGGGDECHPRRAGPPRRPRPGDAGHRPARVARHPERAVLQGGGSVGTVSAWCRTRRDAGDRTQLHAGAWALCALMVLAGCATESMGAETLERPSAWARAIPGVPGLPNLYQVTPTLYRSAQPSRRALRYLGEQRPIEPGAPPIRTVLSLRAFDEDDLGGPAPPSLRLERIRFKTWHPEDEDIVKFLRIATTPALQPVLVHCQHGSDRTGTMVALYRIVVEGWSKEAALLEMTQGGFGFHP